MREFVRHPNTHLILTRNSRKNITRTPSVPQGESSPLQRLTIARSGLNIFSAPGFKLVLLLSKNHFGPWVHNSIVAGFKIVYNVGPLPGLDNCFLFFVFLLDTFDAPFNSTKFKHRQAIKFA